MTSTMNDRDSWEVSPVSPDPAASAPLVDPEPVVPQPPMSRDGSLSIASAVAPSPDRRLPVWDRPVPCGQRVAPAVWLLGAHGGAGVSTLTRMLGPAADCGRAWPAGVGGESPFVVIVARETIEGLARAHDLLRQFHNPGLGTNTVLLGLITSAHQPGRQPKQIRRYLDVIWDLVPETGRWRVDWQSDWPLARLSDLPVWVPDDYRGVIERRIAELEAQRHAIDLAVYTQQLTYWRGELKKATASTRPPKGTDPLASVRGLGESLLDTLKTSVTTIRTTTTGESR